MIKVVYYARVSTEEEQQLAALSTQCKENQDYIEKQDGWVLVDKYIDEAKSGTTTNGRTEFLRLIDDMETDKYDVILIKQIDRGWRNLADWKVFESQLLRNKKRLYVRLKHEFYNMEDDSNYISTTMDSMFAEWFSRNLSKKMNNAHKSRMQKGSIVTNGRMWGYDQKKAELVINEEQADVVRMVFNSYIQGKGFRSIYQELDAIGIRNLNDNPFSVTTLKRMIRNEKYKGTLICGKRHKNFFTKNYEDIAESQWIIHEDRIPPIIDKVIWERANEILNNKRKTLDIDEKSKSAGYFNGSFPLSSKVKCGVCGKPFYHSSYTKKSGMKRCIWQCSKYRMFGKNNLHGCDNITVDDDELKDIIKQTIFGLWNDKDASIKNVMSILDKTLEDDNSQEKISKLSSEKEKVIAKKDKLLDLYSESLISKEEFKKRNDSLTKSMVNIEEQLQAAMAISTIELTKQIRMGKIIEFFNVELMNPEGVSDEIMTALVDEIVIFPDKRIDIVINGTNHHNVSDGVQKWTGYAGKISCSTAGTTDTFACRMCKISAFAGIHRTNKHHRTGESQRTACP